MAFKNPEPENVPGVPVGVGVDVGLVPVVVTGVPDLGRYFTPDDEQLDDAPLIFAGTNVPVWTEPRTSKAYHISSNAPDEH